jgi:hypothetical protein
MPNPAQWGAGDSTAGLTPPSGYYPWGAGSPTPGVIPVLSPGIGGGDPSLPQPIVVQDGGLPYADEGGARVVLLADWATMAGAGPYRVQLRDPFTQAIFPLTRFGCLSPLSGDGVRFGFGLLYTDDVVKRLVFAMPPMPPGVYDILISYGPTYATSRVVESAVRVIRRSRCLQTWTIRAWLASLQSGAGPRQADTQPKIGE